MKTIPFFLLLHLTDGEKKEVLPKGTQNFKYKDSFRPAAIPEYAFLGATFYDNNIDPSTGLKAPIDVFEMRMIYPRTEEEKRYYLKTRPLADIQFRKRPTAPPLIYNPRGDENMTKSKAEPEFFNFAALQARNLELPPDFAQKKPLVRRGPKTSSIDLRKPGENMLGDHSFMSVQREFKFNWTTCDEFKRRSVFHPKDLLNINWIPFYVWSDWDNDIAVVHKFSIPTVKAVMEFKKEYGPYLSENVDWNAPTLLLEESITTLLIAADQRGLFHAIKDQKVSDYIKTHPTVKYPVITLRMKIVDPYLAMMYCDDYYAKIMAIKGEEPVTDQLKAEEAKILNFTGMGYPVKEDPKRDIEKAEWIRLQKIREEESKYVRIRDDDYEPTLLEE